MISSDEFAKLTAQFQQQGGVIEQHEIYRRDYSSPDGGWMMPSANDKPKIEKPNPTRRCRRLRPEDRKPTKLSKVVERIQQKTGESSADIASALGVSRTLVYSAAKTIGVTLPSHTDREYGTPKMDRLLEYLAENKGLSVSKICEHIGCGQKLARKAIAETGYEIPRFVGRYEKAIIAMDTKAMTIKQISSAAKCTQEAALRACVRNNLEYIEQEPVIGSDV